MFKRPTASKRPTPAAKVETPPAAKVETPPAPSAARPAEPRKVEERAAPVSPGPKQQGEPRRPSPEQIALHAYYLWLERGRPDGTDKDDWFEAERRLSGTA